MRHRRSETRRDARNWTRRLVVSAVLALTVAGVVAVASGRYQLRPVLSGSMRPGLPVGGVVITERVPVSSLRVRDVVVFHRPDKAQDLVVHRIVSLTPGPTGPAITTQGDANTAPDPWHETLRGHTAYRVVFSVPLFGYVVVWAHSPTGRLMFFVTGLLFLAVAAGGAALSQRRARRTQQEDRVRASATGWVPAGDERPARAAAGVGSQG